MCIIIVGVLKFHLAVVSLTFKILLGLYLGNYKVYKVNAW